MKRFNDNRNVIGDFIKTYREKKHCSKMELSRKLELLGIELDRFELYNNLNLSKLNFLFQFNFR